MKTTVALLMLFVAILVGGYFFAGHQVVIVRDNGAVSVTSASANTDRRTAADTQSANKTNVKSPGHSTASVAASYTPAQVAAHSTSQSCWTSIHGNVYDLTAWVSQHPGGEAAILSICGKDGTQAFEAQHGGSGDTKPKQMLSTFKIGTLVP